jgi:tetratricopeptide (TPR) repeat protein
MGDGSSWDGEVLRSTGSREPEENEQALQALLERATLLCELRDGAFKFDPVARQADAAAILSLVDAIPRSADSRRARAVRCFVRGKLLDEGDANVSEAVEELSRAVKLYPTLGGAWNQLGTCMWKKGDVQLAHDCWQSTLMHCTEQEHCKEAMRKLSMAFRSSKGNNPDESLRLAKELISRDMSDTQSWTNLGNAYMSYFFASSLDREDLFRALKAYHRSDLDGQSQDPDLHYNKGTVYRYLEDYQNAMIELQRADELDKELNASVHVEQMRKLVLEMHSMIARQCNIKPGRLATVLAILPTLTGPIAKNMHTP